MRRNREVIVKTETKRPGECSSDEINAFRKLVIIADEVDPEGFDARVVTAERLIFLY